MCGGGGRGRRVVTRGPVVFPVLPFAECGNAEIRMASCAPLVEGCSDSSK